MKSVLLAVGLCGGCSFNLATANKAGLATSAALLACDMMQTYGAAWDGERGFYGPEQHWEGGFAGKFIGGRPPPSLVLAYFLTAGVLILGGAQALPERWRPIIYGAVITAELPVVLRNQTINRGPYCGMGAALVPPSLQQP